MTAKAKAVTTEVGEVEVGTKVRLSDGSMAEVVEIGDVVHVETLKHNVRVLTYKLLEGPHKGHRNSTPVLSTDDIDIVPEEVSLWERFKSVFRRNEE